MQLIPITTSITVAQEDTQYKQLEKLIFAAFTKYSQIS